jgi:hypothetical protein
MYMCMQIRNLCKYTHVATIFLFVCWLTFSEEPS